MSLHLLGSILYGNLFPIFLVVGVGYLIERLLHPDIQSTSRLTFYTMSPCLVFDSLVRSQVGGDEMGRIGLVAVVVMLSTGGIAWLLARPLRLSPRQTSAFVLVAIFVNSGNYGLSLTELAFGEEALARAVVYFVMSTVLLYTLGVYIAALGGQGKGVGSALRSILRVPAVYALALAGLIRATGFTLPLPLTQAVSLLGRAAIPVMLLILGMQLATIS
ncbi:MAG TPA: AEC family transporter, partial [Chloroflexi bacterium]|nr:AEC family transporter [Chloroflexota bacterium]